MHDSLVQVAVEAARSAGRFLREAFTRPRHVGRKGPKDLVTDADRRAEQLILTCIRNHFPDHRILAEETGVLPGVSGITWVVDPLDGTTNYAHGYPCFAVSIAACADGTLLAGAVYDPMRDEMFTAQRGGGAFLNGTPVRVSTTDALSEALVATGFPYDMSGAGRQSLNQFVALALRSQEIRRAGSAALDLCAVACGRFDAYWEIGIDSWDIAAGALMVQEAGGRVTGFTGKPVDLTRREVLATNGTLHPQMIEALAAA